MATLDAFTEDGAKQSGEIVVATCSDCGETHPVAERERSADTPASTVCPSCDSPRYSTDVLEEEVEG